jgi:serine/threonine protein phosphatase PrpC
VKIIGKGISLAGPCREVNEDLLHLDNAQQLFLLADGMGGHAGGCKASQLAVSVVSHSLLENFASRDRDTVFHESESDEEFFTRAVSNASQTIFQTAQTDPRYTGMGTTFTGLVQCGGNGVLMHVGDSRLYLYRSDVLHQLTHDHTLVSEMLESGEITPTQAIGHEYSHVLTRAVGTYESVLADTLVFELAVGDRFFLCSDGFYELFSEYDEMLQFLQREMEGDLFAAVERISEERKSSDNVSLAMLEVCSEPESHEADAAASEEVVLKVDTLRQVYLFQHLEIKEIAALVQSGLVHRLQPGEVIVEEGAQENQSLYVILEGEVEVLKGEEILATLSSGNHFGEMSLLLESPRTATVKAKRATSVLELPLQVITRFLHRSPKAGIEFLYAMSREFAKRLEQSNARRY